jgi:hypothetical protein
MRVMPLYGTTRRATLKHCDVSPFGGQCLTLVDELNECHIIVGHASDAGKPGDTGTLIFTEGGPTGGYWRFLKDWPR